MWGSGTSLSGSRKAFGVRRFGALVYENRLEGFQVESNKGQRPVEDRKGLWDGRKTIVDEEMERKKKLVTEIGSFSVYETDMG